MHLALPQRICWLTRTQENPLPSRNQSKVKDIQVLTVAKITCSCYSLHVVRAKPAVGIVDEGVGVDLSTGLLQER